MKRSDDSIEARVYAYGCAEPVSGLADAEREVALQRALWDRLVDIDQASERATWETAAADVPEIADALAEVDRLSSAIDAAITARRAARQKARARIPTPELDVTLDQLFPERREARAQLVALLKGWRKTFKAHTKRIADTRKAAVASARQESGLYWGNYNRVLQSYDTARKLALKKGRRLRPSDATRQHGCLTVQIQRTQSGLGASMHELLAGAFSGVSIDCSGVSVPRGTRPPAIYAASVDLRIDAAGNRLVLPVFLHRLPPEDARIKSVQLTWRQIGERRRYQLALTLTRPAAPVVHPGREAIGIDLGWRLQPDGSLLVATCLDTTGSVTRLALPSDWMAGMDQVQRLASHVDDITLALAQELLEVELPSDLRRPLERWRPGLGSRHVDVAGLHDAIRARIRHAQASGARADVPPVLRAWYDRYRHLALWRDNLRARLGRRRLDIYRNWAHRLAVRYPLIGLEDMDLSQMARTKKRPDASDPELHAPARAQRVRAAVHLLRTTIQHQAAKAGAEIAMIAGKTTMACRACTHTTGQHDRANRLWTCEHCHATWDQDINAAENILAAAIGASTPAVKRVA